MGANLRQYTLISELSMVISGYVDFESDIIYYMFYSVFNRKSATTHGIFEARIVITNMVIYVC